MNFCNQDVSKNILLDTLERISKKQQTLSNMRAYGSAPNLFNTRTYWTYNRTEQNRILLDINYTISF